MDEGIYTPVNICVRIRLQQPPATRLNDKDDCRELGDIVEHNLSRRPNDMGPLRPAAQALRSFPIERLVDSGSAPLKSARSWTSPF